MSAKQRFANDGEVVKGKTRAGLLDALHNVFKEYGFENPDLFAEDATDDALCMDGAPLLEGERQ